MLNFFGPKCPKCGSRDVNKVEESIFKKLTRLPMYLLFFITIFFIKGQKPLLVCKSCGFSWEKR